MACTFTYFKLNFAKSLYPEMQVLRSQAFHQHSQGQDSQPLSYSIEPGKSIRRTPTANDRIVRNTHPCVSRVVRKFDSCRRSWVNELQCKRTHPACSYVIKTHGIPKCQPVYGFRNATFVEICPSLTIDCQCAV